MAARTKSKRRSRVARRDRTIARILALLRDAHGGRDLRIADAAERYGVSVRTLFRDLRTLKNLGIAFRMVDDPRDPSRRSYRLDDRKILPASRLSLEEAIPLALAGRQLFGKRQIPLLESASGGIERVLDTVSKPVESDLSKLERRISVRLAPRNAARGLGDLFRSVVDAMLRGRQLDAVYKSAYDLTPSPPQRFKLDPFALVFRHRAWYMLGRRPDQGRVKLYKLVRFKSLIATSVRFELPAGFDADTHFGHAWSVIRGRPRERVEIDFAPDFAGNIADTEWHPTQTVSMRPDGSMRFTCQVDGLDEITWWVLSMGSHARVISPAALARRVAAEAAATTALYAAAAPKRTGSGASPPARSRRRRIAKAT
ncbi:MAG: WYL domain-containing transcriptional regulator [Phycisphaeraceae bacterium]|nr:WYL domain-containing transcriptional regulator [Phycisphaeraceae bacterium]